MTENSVQILRVGHRSPRLVHNLRERAIAFLLFLAAFSSVATTIAILAILVYESVSFFQEVPIWNFLTDTKWSPLFEDAHYGILPLLSGTLVTTAVALFVAIPIGTISAIYLSEFAPLRLREVVKPGLELLVGIPTVVYGYFALLAVTPWLQKLLPDLPSSNMLSAGIVMGIMIIPYVSSVSEDAMRAVPLYLREGSAAMGATRLQTAWKIVFPAAISGIIAAYILGISRAIGETMIVAIAAGLQPIFTLNPMDEAATITAYIVSVSLGDLPHGTLEYKTIFAAGLTLVLITLLFNILGYFLSKKYREFY
ncbi:phosphate ABC transporter permease subunit PstC [Merismopedia glauca]|uniref:Phosphate transport system permease protein n=1 Tax=Merismopedia glauca CCAP 1448/3 TaxID=1296344 RepID=A0A2T1BY86_9CYAN|nr:phosphate ABC transporter permease subunit PstC [Merismopedia glauca]PSB00962.1 phosphate ABC transporter permease subunit PstC [Merismopedia glauca CCAP 1448/3]